MTRDDIVNVLVNPRGEDVHSSASDVSRLVIEVDTREVFLSVRRLIAHGTVDAQDVEKITDMLTTRVRATLHPVIAYLDGLGVSYEVNLPQGAVYLPKAGSVLESDIKGRFVHIVKGVKLFPDGETFHPKTDFVGVKLY